MAILSIRLRPVGSDDEALRQALKYEWLVEGETVTAYSMPANVAAEDVTISELDITDATALINRLHAERESLRGISYEKAIL